MHARIEDADLPLAHECGPSLVWMAHCIDEALDLTGGFPPIDAIVVFIAPEAVGRLRVILRPRRERPTALQRSHDLDGELRVERRDEIDRLRDLHRIVHRNRTLRNDIARIVLTCPP